MGSLLSCFSHAEPQPKRAAYAAAAAGPSSSSRSSKARSTRDGERAAEAGLLTDEQALAAAALLLQHSGGAPVFDRSASLRYPPVGGKRQQQLSRSLSSRPRSLADPLIQPQQLLNQDIRVDDLETNHFVLVHGGGFGAWCWYKTIALLEDAGFKVIAIDLTGSGIDSSNTNSIASLPQYVRPLMSVLEKFNDGEKVILVGHDFGGACISYAMEQFPLKIAKAIFISAAMLTNGQSTLAMFSQQAGVNDLMQKAQVFLYADGKDHPPTAIDLDRALLKDLLFNQSPAKDVALASVSMRPIPVAPAREKLSLTEKNYGSVRRFFIQTTEDNVIPLPVQQSMCASNPPEKVFRIKGSDHSPFFSKPQGLHKLLVEISKITSIQVKLATHDGVSQS